ncbi:MAG TPA: nucleotidyltransferase family protein [Candidatus Omnitrophica bacterium]|nr:nucleotidyltransferase family protein [Candidatus Omnitrophota bacterium]
MQAVILSAGYGTRLYPLTKTTPKSLLPVAGRPVLEYVLEKLKYLELDKQVIVTNDRYYPKFLEWLSEYIPYFPTVVLSDRTKNEKEKLGALGDLKLVIQKEGIDDDILLLTSDMIFSFSLNRFINAVNTRPRDNWILLYKLKTRKEASRYGVAQVDELGRVVKFQEKPSEPFSNYVSFGVYYLPRNKLGLISEFLKTHKKTDAPGEYFQWLIENDSLYGFIQSGGIWIDIGDKHQYYGAEEIVKKSRRLLWQR